MKSKKVSPLKSARSAVVERNTKETRISVRLNIDGCGDAKVRTGIGFLDHMLVLLAKHGMFDVDVKAKGDLHIDRHHTNEDVAITLGQAFSKALGNKAGIKRYGFFYAPMGEALSRVCLDISGRPSFYFRCDLKLNQRGENYKLEDAEHFLESFAQQAGINMHVDVLAGKQHHHAIEAVFKSFARALDQASQIDAREKGIPSTKGAL
ncbi:MAG: imidazoleglycerol-phosphate dehydratase [Omnitrophica bacterium GWA2_50_21]|nr:MAG: imidazoleglycerol-phosphate dehydratase [Omnitrophica bacterium GWA2_50_21]